ncbi:MAG: aminopeptidase [Verrucomicrobia bacterium]|nr:aminopeptidase [Verrucomicrobiota bacterium]
MHDSRVDDLARQLVRYSTKVKKGDNVLVEIFDAPDSMAIALIRAIRAAGGTPFVNLHRSRVTRELALRATEEQYEVVGRQTLAQMQDMQVYIAVRGSENINEQADVPEKAKKLVAAQMRPTLNHRINETRWVVLRWPTPSMAQQAMMSTEAFEDFYFRVCLLDYKALLPGMKALKKAIDEAREVRITGPGTDLRFSLEGMQGIVCEGRRNIPDGEVFTAPVRDSVEGVISFNAPTVYQGIAFDQIKLRFEKGRIVEATSNQTKKLNEILDSDEGSRYIGEFAIAFNNEIKEPMRDILFDEKIGGSFHFTPGQAYEGVADNGNRSQVHWDMVLIQRKEWGGGEIYFDDKLIRKDGLFVPKSLESLNPA